MKYRIRINNPAIGVPITWLDKKNGSGFELIDFKDSPVVNGKPIYKRLIIRKEIN